MALFYERKERPGVHKVIGSLRGTLPDGTTPGGDSGGGTAAASLSVSDGVLICSGAAPRMDGTTLVITPTPTMAGNVMTLS